MFGLLFLVFTYFFFILLAYIVNFRSKAGSCRKYFRKCIKDVAYLPEQINMLDALLSVPENKTSIDLLCSNCNRIADITNAVRTRCITCSMELTNDQWSLLQTACTELLAEKNSPLSTEYIENSIKNKCNDLNLYALEAVPLVMNLVALCELQRCVTSIVNKQRKVRRIKRIAENCGMNALRDELIIDSEQIFNLICYEHSLNDGKYSTLINETEMYHGMSVGAICDKYKEINFCLCKKIGGIINYILTSDINVENIISESKTENYFNEIDNSYKISDKITKSYYRMWLNRFCNSASRTETEILNSARELSLNKDGIRRLPSYYLIGYGQDDLIKALKCDLRSNSALKTVNCKMFFLINCIILLGVITAMSFFITDAIRFLICIASLLPCILSFSISANEAFFKRITEIRPTLCVDKYDLFAEKTLVVVPCLLGSIKKSIKMVEKLELCRLSNPGFCYALLCDFPSGALTNDEKMCIKSNISDAINALNEKYNGEFCLFLRGNSICNGILMPKERKRGALLALCNYIKNGKNEFESVIETRTLSECEYIFTMDEDSALLPGTVDKMQRAILHPLNANSRGRRALLEPDVISTLPYKSNSYFAKWYMQDRLIPAYPSSSAWLYNIFLDYCPFGGKGIFCIEDYLKTGDILPQNKILSHDQPEGDILNCGKNTIAQLAEDVPQSVEEYLNRQHRWMRGDWQNFFYLITNKNLSTAFKLCCVLNCIFSLKEFLLLLGLLIITVFYPRSLAVFLTLALFLKYNGIFGEILHIAFKTVNKKYFLTNSTERLLQQIRRSLIDVIMLPCIAITQMDAFITSIWRVLISKKNLLEWNNASGKNESIYALYWASPFFGMFLLLFCIYNHIVTVLPLLFCSAFLVSPIVYKLLERVKHSKNAIYNKISITSKEMDTLYSLSERTVRYFLNGMTEDNNYLPPDNYQEEPYKGFCARTSITNIGFGVLSLACSYALGLLPKHYIYDLLDKTVESIESLPTCNGCHYNWYDVKNKEKLGDFVSAVDCGNFITCLLCASELLKDLENTDDFNEETSKKIYYILCQDAEIAQANNDFAYVKDLNIDGIKEFLYNFDPKLCKNTITGSILTAWQEALYVKSTDVTCLSERFKNIANNEKIEFLFDKDKDLFYIGYDTKNQKYTLGHYDLLASENLLCSYFSICSGKVPSEHWYKLSRKFSGKNGSSTLCSWSGTSFEALMPHIFLDYGQDGLLRALVNDVIKKNIDVVECINTPFGISESCCGEINSNGDYCYEAFGVAELALDTKQTAPVFSPYSSIMAIELRPKEVYDNIKRFVQLGMANEFGLYESIDYRYDPPITVKCYMAHHQGMIIASLCNFLCDGAVRRAFMRCPEIKAGRLLLHEQEPTLVNKRHNYISSYIIDANAVISARAARLIWGKCVLDVSPYGFGLRFDDVTVLPLGIYDHQKSGKFYYHDGEKTHPVYWSYIESSLYRIKCACNINGITIKCEFVPLMMRGGLLLNLTFEGHIPTNAKIIMCSDVILNSDRNYDSHPFYSNLFVKCKKDNNTAVCHSSRNGGAINSAVALRCYSSGASYHTMGENIKPRNRIYTVEPAEGEDFEVSFEPVIAFDCRIMRSSPEINAVINTGYSADGVLDDLDRMQIDMDEIRLAALEMSKCLISKNKLDIHDVFNCLRIAQPLVLGTDRKENCACCRDDFYRLGLSGDNKVISVVFSSCEIEELLDILKCLSVMAKERIDLLLLPKDGITDEAEDRIVSFLGSLSKNEIANYRMITSDHDKYKALSYAVISCKDINCCKTVYPLRLSYGSDFVPSYIGKEHGFCHDGYYIAGSTPMPWCNVLSNGKMGCVIGENGGGYSFEDNSSLTRFTAASDSIRNDASEIVYLRNSSGNIWSITSYPIDRGDEHHTKHSFGYSEFYYNGFNIDAVQTVFIHPEKKQKLYKIRLTNSGKHDECMTVGIYLNAFIGVSTKDKKYCKYSVGENYAKCQTEEGSLYLLGGDEFGVCTEGFFGKSYNICEPSLDCKYEGNADCLCSVANVSLKVNETKEIVFCLSRAIDNINIDIANLALNSICEYYNALLNTVKFSIGNYDFDSFASKWLPYQTLNSRFLARCGYYQSSGGFGFRDQLQDCLCLMYYDKDLARSHILNCASHQFEYGDVQHWWHNDTLGVRSGFSDDKLWLVYVACKYSVYTQDKAVFDERRPYFVGKDKPCEQTYGDAEHTEESYTLYDHCKRAIISAMNNGEHGLPLILNGDWNDAMDEVGINGNGESVWLAWFLLAVCDLFEPIITSKNDTEFLLTVCKYCADLKKSVEKFAWEEDRYLRAFTDDGYKIGSADSSACCIDAISQAWAIISGFCDADRGNTCIKNAYNMLYDKKHQVLKLFLPPFNNETVRAGYINDYPEGIRENAGQYSHGAIWLAKALAMSGYADEAWNILKCCMPFYYNSERLLRFGNEPYVVTADIYADGRGGWSWYTGASGWLFTTILEDIFGIRISGDTLRIEPCFPSELTKARVVLRIREKEVTIEYKNPFKRAGGERKIYLNGMPTDVINFNKYHNEADMEYKITVVV